MLDVFPNSFKVFTSKSYSGLRSLLVVASLGSGFYFVFSFFISFDSAAGVESFPYSLSFG